MSSRVRHIRVMQRMTGRKILSPDAAVAVVVVVIITDEDDEDVGSMAAQAKTGHHNNEIIIKEGRANRHARTAGLNRKTRG